MIATIGILGAGRSGCAVARLALAAGYQVRIAGSGPAERTAAAVRRSAPGARAVGADQVPGGADLVVLAVPLRQWRRLPLDRLAGRVVLDLMNYWPAVDGVLPEFEVPGRPTSAVIRDALPDSARLVKTLNHLSYRDVERRARRAAAPDRLALGVAGDDSSAVAAVAEVLDRLGFDAVETGGLGDSAVLQPDRELFGAHLDRARWRRELARWSAGAQRGSPATPLS